MSSTISIIWIKWLKELNIFLFFDRLFVINFKLVMGDYFSSSIVWYNISFSVLVAIQIIAAGEFKGSYLLVRNALSVFATVGLVFCLIRLIMISIKIDWWYGLVSLFLSFIFCGVVAAFIGRLGRLVVGLISFVVIPILWYFGGMF